MGTALADARHVEPVSASSSDALAARSLRGAFAASVASLAASERPAVFGGGDLGRAIVDWLRQAGAPEPVIIDNHLNVTEVDGVRVLTLRRALAEYRPDSILLATLSSADDMTRTLAEEGFTGTVLHAGGCRAGSASPAIVTAGASTAADINAYRDIHRGRRAFVIGNGRSLLKTDPRLLHGELTFACNNIHYLDGFTPSYYFVEDKLLCEDRSGTIESLPWTKFFPSILRGIVNDGVFLPARPSPWPAHFSTDLSQWIEVNFTVTYCMLQLAYFMGVTEVYLIGLDHSYVVDGAQAVQEGNRLTSVSDDPNHFHPEYFGKGRRWHNPRVDRMEAAYQVAKTAFEAAGRRICNATEGGKLEVFPRVRFEDVIDRRRVARSASDGRSSNTEAAEPVSQTAPAPPPSREDLLARVESLKPWYHNIALPHGIHTISPEKSPARGENWSQIVDALPQDLTGLSVLDLGCNAGALSFECKRRGAARVVGIDYTAHFVTQAKFCRAALELEVEFRTGDVVAELARINGQFDIVIAVGLLYHLPDPFSFMTLVGKVTSSVLILETVMTAPALRDLPVAALECPPVPNARGGSRWVNYRLLEQLVTREGRFKEFDYVFKGSRACIRAVRSRRPSSSELATPQPK